MVGRIRWRQKSTDTAYDKYERKTPLEHILLRPGMYVGQTEWTTANMYLYDRDAKRMVQKQVTYSPALFKIFDEIIVNAADNSQRDKSMTSIDVHISPTDTNGI